MRPWSSKTRHIVSVVTLFACAACGDDSGGGGGAGPYDGQTVLGTRQEKDCETAEAFAAKCAEEGGLLDDRCQDAAHCGGNGYGARCYAPPPSPTTSEFVCDGLFLCAAGTMCVSEHPLADGCFEHLCEAMPAACADDPTCACVEGLDAAGHVTSCTADDAGHLTVKRSKAAY